MRGSAATPRRCRSCATRFSGEKRDAVLDTVCIGSIGLLGNADDIALIERFKGDARRSSAVEAAIKRIREREESF